MKTYYFYKDSVNKLFFEIDEDTKRVAAFSMHCDPAMIGTVTRENHKGLWIKLPQICETEMTVFLSNAKYQKIKCTKKEAFAFQDERREKKMQEILEEYKKRK